MDTKILFQVMVSVYAVFCVVSAEILRPGTLKLGVGTSATLTCRQRGQSGTNMIDDPVFVVRTPDGQTTRPITGDSDKYFLVRGIINLSGTIPERHYQLGISEVSVEDDGMKVICISEEDSMDPDILDDEFQNFAKTLKVKAYEGCPTSSSEQNVLISTEKTTNMEETTSMTSGSSADSITSRRDQLTTDLPKSDESDPEQGARKDQGEASSTNNGLDTMTSLVIVLAVCLIIALAACAVLYYKYRLYRTKYMSSGSHTNTTVIKMQTVDETNGHLPQLV